MEARVMLRLCLLILRATSRVVPAADRAAWLQEWEGELRERWLRLQRGDGLNRTQQVKLLRRILGSFHDAAWLRRQFTRDSDAVHDLKHGVRLLRRSPGFALIAILVLALGTGATVGIFSVFDTLLVRALPFADADRTVLIWQGNRTDADVRDDVSPANCIDWREELRLFEDVACAMPFSFDYNGGTEPVVLHAAGVDDGFFRAFGVEPMLGRAFTADEYLRGRNRVIVISHGMWQQTLGGDRGIIGRTVILDGTGYVVVGVLPPAFRPRILQGSGERGIYFPHVIDPEERRIRGSNYWNVVARLRRGVTVEQGQAELDAVSARLAQQYPRTNGTVVARAQPLRDHLAGSMRPALRLLIAAVGLLLAIAAANVANLLLARAAERARELAVRSAVGAGRGRIVRQMLAESLLLAVLGSAAGLGVAWVTIQAIVALSPAGIPAVASVAIDGRVMTFACLLTGAVALLVGTIPAWHSSRGGIVHVLRTFSAGAGPSRHNVRNVIVVAEVALALLLTTGAGLLLRSFSLLIATDPGFDAGRVVALQVFAWDRNTTPEKRAVFFQQVLERMRSRPMVRDAGAVAAMPFIEANINMETAITVEGRTLADGDAVSAYLDVITPGYFPVMRVSRREGRDFTVSDVSGRTPVAIVSGALARRLAPDGGVVGSRIRYRYQGRMLPAEIVGVVADIRHDGLDRPARPELFVPHAQVPFGSMTFVARVDGDPAAAIPDLKAQIHAVDPSQAIYRAAVAADLVARSLVERRFMLALLTGFALLAAVLAATGIYGVISVATTQRTSEFGLRMALGADRREILWMVLRDGAGLAAAGLLLGLGGALTLGRVMERFLFGITPGDPLTLALCVMALAIVALMACISPARRATRVDPLSALRAD